MSILKKNIDHGRRQQGSALVIAIIVLAILGALGFAALDVADLNIFMSANDRDSKEAFFYADSGANVGQQMIMNVRDGNSTFSGSHVDNWIDDPFNALDYPLKTHNAGAFVTHVRAGWKDSGDLPGFSIEFGTPHRRTFTEYIIKSRREGQRKSWADIEVGWIKIQDGLEP